MMVIVGEWKTKLKKRNKKSKESVGFEIVLLH